MPAATDPGPDPSGVHRRLGAHPIGDPTRTDPRGVDFGVWAPHAGSVCVVGDWNGWDRTASPLVRNDAGEWHGSVDAAQPGHRYRFAVTGPDGSCVEHADPLAFRCEAPPGTASIVHVSEHRWGDARWQDARGDLADRPMSIYEVHVGSWRAAHGYAELADALVSHVTDLGFTHVELLPVMAHPFAGSWGYQVTSYFAPNPIWGSPDELKALIDALHQADVGVILDWVPAHFPADAWALADFDGTALYERAERGLHPDWDTLEFDLTKPQVQAFLRSSARWWLEEYHADGLRFDAVASMLYLDYSRRPGEWQPNEHGGNEHLEAVSLLRSVNDQIAAQEPRAFTVAEESTAWPGVTSPASDDGLGFSFKWDLGWMHDTLRYLHEDPVHRRHHHRDLTFPMHYATSERFVLPLSHDEVVHGKGSLVNKLPGQRPQQLANLRALLAWMWAHPGKKLLFMGAELASGREWDHDGALDWDLLDDPAHRGVAELVGALNRAYRARPALWSRDHATSGHRWLVADDADANLAAFSRLGTGGEQLVCVANFADAARPAQPIPLPDAGAWRVVLDTDASGFGGSSDTTGTVLEARAPEPGGPAVAPVDLGPLSVVWLEPAGGEHPRDR